ncbi:MAG: hypothetical protein OXH52_14645 [Gammaproteobacteria bacterium]|nr:hypothetical protein [Gammaproteobacteria bacterium]
MWSKDAWNLEGEMGGPGAVQATGMGYRSGERGTHSSRTLMLAELSLLLESVPGEAVLTDYRDAVLIENCLGKHTVATRAISFQRLKELYALDEGVPMFRVLRQLWCESHPSRPLLALLMGLARDPLLRATAAPIIQVPAGVEVMRQSVQEALANSVGTRFNEATLDTVVRNTMSSWTQSGHLRGRSRKVRERVEATPAATAFALLLGYLPGKRGYRLFETPWAAVLDSDPGRLLDLAGDARRLGLLDLKQSGSMLDVSFPRLKAMERELTVGTN